MRSSVLFLAFLFAATGCGQVRDPFGKRVLDAYDLRAAALKQAKQQHKHVLIWFSSDDKAWCEPFDRFHSDPEVASVLNKYFMSVRIDYYRTASAEPLYYETGENRGLPAFTILDENGALLSDSGQDQASNFGFPTTVAELNAYAAALLAAQPAIADAELELLRAKLQLLAPAVSPPDDQMPKEQATQP